MGKKQSLAVQEVENGDWRLANRV